MNTLNLGESDPHFILEVEQRSGQNIRRCYQCGACTGRCPNTFAYDMPVNRVMRLIQLGRRKEVLSSSAIWLCAACQACAVQCPNEIDVTRVMEVCRQMSAEAGLVAERAMQVFIQSFLGSIKRNGRAFEPGLMAGYMFKTGRFLTDVDLAPAMLAKRKLAFKPHKAGNGEVAEIFRRYREAGPVSYNPENDHA